jgi:uncharacterized membrane protein YtjA (UPF0391 family)
MVRPGRIVALVAFVVALISGVLAWFVKGSNSYSLINGYEFVIKLVSGGLSSSSPAFSSGLGTLISPSSSNFTLLLLTLTITLIFWPACVVSGLIELLGRSVRPHPAIYGIIGLITAYLFASSISGTAVGVGFILEVVAVIVFFVAYFVDRASASRRKEPRTYVCSQCGARFDTSQALANHMAAAHPMGGPTNPTPPPASP